MSNKLFWISIRMSYLTPLQQPQNPWCSTCSASNFPDAGQNLVLRSLSLFQRWKCQENSFLLLPKNKREKVFTIESNQYCQYLSNIDNETSLEYLSLDLESHFKLDLMTFYMLHQHIWKTTIKWSNK